MKINLKLEILLIVCCIFLAKFANAEDKSNSNILKNGSFEKVNPFCLSSESHTRSKPFYGWDCLGGWLNNISVSREAIDGNASVLFTSPCWITRSVKVEAGKKYLVSGYFRTALQTMPDGTDFGAYFEIRAANKVLLYRSITGIHDWTKLSGELTVPAGVKWVKINIGLKTTTGVCWADGFKITEKK
jgi:hypothetical protein